MNERKKMKKKPRIYRETLEDSLRCLGACGHEFTFLRVELSPVDKTVKLIVDICSFCQTERPKTITQLTEMEKKQLESAGFSLRR